MFPNNKRPATPNRPRYISSAESRRAIVPWTVITLHNFRTCAHRSFHNTREQRTTGISSTVSQMHARQSRGILDTWIHGPDVLARARTLFRMQIVVCTESWLRRFPIILSLEDVSRNLDPRRRVLVVTRKRRNACVADHAVQFYSRDPFPRYFEPSRRIRILPSGWQFYCFSLAGWRAEEMEDCWVSTVSGIQFRERLFLIYLVNCIGRATMQK